MFHYPRHYNDRCNLLGPDSVDPSIIRFVRFRRCFSARIAGQGVVPLCGEMVGEVGLWSQWGSGRR